MRVHKGVILAAGHGTRFLPATKAHPKEMLPLVDRPIIQYVVEEAVASGLDQIIMVTSAGKRAVEDYFDRAPDLERHLDEKGHDERLEEMRARDGGGRHRLRAPEGADGASATPSYGRGTSSATSRSSSSSPTTSSTPTCRPSDS